MAGITVSLVPGSMKNTRADMKLTLPDLVTDDPSHTEALSQKARKWIEDAFPRLAREVPSLENASVEKIFPQLGVRVQRRARGKYILQEADVLACREFQSGIAIGTWPIEEWREEGRVSMSYFPERMGYSIPADCLISGDCANLFLGGKNISATDRAIASARVMGTCIQTGYAAGKLAAGNTRGDIENTIRSLKPRTLS